MPVYIWVAYFYVMCVIAAIWSYFKLERLKRYEFENRTEGGVVQFQSYEQSKAHASTKNFYLWINRVSVRVVGFGLVIIVIVAAVDFYSSTH